MRCISPRSRLSGIRRSPEMDNETDPGIDWWELDPRPFPEVSRATMMQTAADDLIQCLDTGRMPRSTGVDGLAALEMIMAIYESQRRGNAVLDHLRARFQDPALDQEVGLLWLGEDASSQLDRQFCDWKRSRGGDCALSDLNRSAFVTWIDCTL